MTNKEAVCYAITTAYARRIITETQLKELLAIYEAKEVINLTKQSWGF